MSVWNRMWEINEQFDYGEKMEDPQFWINMMRSQVDELEEALENGDDEHLVREFVDCMLVGQKGIMESPNVMNSFQALAVTQHRIHNIEERIPDIMEKYEEDGYRRE